MGYELELEVSERIHVPDLSPNTSNMQTMFTMRDILEKVRIGSEEMEEIGFSTKAIGEGKLHHQWNTLKAKTKSVNFTEAEMQLLKGRVSELDNAKQITDEMLDICTKVKNAGTKEPEEDGGE